MKRRNFLKWLGISPAGLKVVHDQIAEPVKAEPEKVKPVAPKPQRVKLEPQYGQNLTASSFTITADPACPEDHMYLLDLKQLRK